MRVEVSVDDGEDAGDLLAWLNEDGIAREAVFTTAPGGPADMGVGDVIHAVGQHAESIVGLWFTLLAWRAARRGGRPTGPVVRIRRGAGTVEVTDGDPGP